MTREALLVVGGILLLVGGVACGDDKKAARATPAAGQSGGASDAAAGQGGYVGDVTVEGGSGGLTVAGAGDGGRSAEGGGVGTSGSPSCTSFSDCDDQNPCTDDVCADDGTCTNSNNAGTCDDANECTDDDVCKDGACTGTPNAIACDDLSSCTSDDECGAGACNGSKDLVLCPSCAVSGNILQNCDFADGGTHWVDGFTDSRGRQWVDNQRLWIDIEESGVEAEDVQPRVEGLTLRQGMLYRLRLVAGASVDRTVSARVVQSVGPHRAYATLGLQLSAQMKPFSAEWRMTAPTDQSALLELALGGEEGNPSRVYVDDVALEEVPCRDDKECDDANDCTLDTCDNLAGTCSWNNTGAACSDDANDCTNDVCVAGKCEHEALGGDGVCSSDGDPCTVDACSNGLCQHAFDAGVCACTLDGQCDDGNPCTDDKCNAGVCEYAENSASCDDGNACTSKDVCSGGLCAGVSSTDSCDDGDECTVADACAGGFCRPGTNVCLDCSAAPNVLFNCDFAAGELRWLRGFFGTATGSQRVDRGMLVVEIESGGADPSQVAPRQEGLLLRQGTTYVVSLNARASVARKLEVAIVHSNGGHRAYFPPHTFSLTTELAGYTFELPMNDAPPEELSQLELRLGGPEDNATRNTVWIDNVSLSPKP